MGNILIANKFHFLGKLVHPKHTGKAFYAAKYKLVSRVIVWGGGVGDCHILNKCSKVKVASKAVKASLTTW